MPNSRLIDGQFAVGDPCWFDLITDDVPRATEFYSHVFGWTFEPVSAASNGASTDSSDPVASDYQLASIGERKVAGIGQLADSRGREATWLVHFAAPNLDGMTARITELGGVVAEPIDIAGMARRAIVKDPSGAEFGAWDPSRLRSPALTETPGTVHWTELRTRDPKSAAGFYEALFDVEAVAVEPKEGEEPSGALNLQRTELGQPRMVAGIQALAGDASQSSSGDQEPRSDPHWRLYFLVDDVARCVRLAEESGGTVVDNQRDASERQISVLKDPLGAEFGVVQRGTGSRD